jgi:hypothetical protein
MVRLFLGLSSKCKTDFVSFLNLLSGTCTPLDRNDAINSLLFAQPAFAIFVLS